MIGLESLRWLLTVAFGGASAFHLIRCLRPARTLPVAVGEHRFSEILHLMMGLAMIAMIWPWGDVVPLAVWITAFTLSAGWFVARAVWTAGRRLVLGFFASTMAMMVWMGAAMPAQASAGHHDAMASMPMSGGGTMVGYVAWVSGVLGAYLIVAAFWWAFRGLRLSGPVVRPLNWPSLCHALMSAGMGLALLAMA